MSEGLDSQNYEKVKSLDSQNFEKEVLSAEGFVLVDFFATWCGPCKMLSPIIDEISEDSELNLTVGKLDIDKAPDIAGNFGVMSVPTVILFKDGTVVNRHTGFIPKEDLKKQIIGIMQDQKSGT